MLDSVDLGITLIDNDFNVVIANRRQAEIVGASRTELVGTKCYQRFEGCSELCQGCPGVEAMAERCRTEVERTGHRNGTPFAVRLKASPVIDEGGQVTGFVEVVEDIRERKAQERHIAWLATFPEESPNLVVSIGPDGTLLYGNPAGLRLLDEWRKTEPAPVPGPWLEHASAAMVSGSSQDVEWQFGDRSYTLTFAPSINHRCVNIYGMETTQRKQAETALRISEEKYRSYVNDSPLGIFIADPQGRFVDVNPAACRMSQYGVDELLRMSIPDILTPDSTERGMQSFRDVKETGQSAADLRFRQKHGGTLEIAIQAVQLSPDCFIGFCEDITAQAGRRNVAA